MRWPPRAGVGALSGGDYDGGVSSADAFAAPPMSVQPDLAEYQQRVDMLRASTYLEYPAHVHMETLSLCNAECGFCPYVALDRKGTAMSDELIAKILDDLTAIPRSVPFQISPFKVNEPFLDKRIFDVLEEIHEKLPQAKIALTTNATPLTDDKLARLARLPNIAYLWISFNDHRPEHYERIMALPYGRTIERLNAIHRRKAAGRLHFPVVTSRVGDGTPDDDEFCAWINANYPYFSAAVFQRGAWIGQVDTPTTPPPNVGCARWFELSITATGVVAHCCMDGKAEHPIGDVTRQHVLDVYNDPKYRALRERTLSRLDVEPCRRCSFL
jgi:MoaA/NifB/PqqE/SkfB family radical SAM enzyme